LQVAAGSAEVLGLQGRVLQEGLLLEGREVEARGQVAGQTRRVGFGVTVVGGLLRLSGRLGSAVRVQQRTGVLLVDLLQGRLVLRVAGTHHALHLL